MAEVEVEVDSMADTLDRVDMVVAAFVGVAVSVAAVVAGALLAAVLGIVVDTVSDILVKEEVDTVDTSS